MMRLSPESRFFLEKAVKQSVQPAEVFLCGLVGALTFLLIFWSLCFNVRYTDPHTSILIVALCILVGTCVTLVGAVKYRRCRPSRAWFASAVCLWGSIATGYVLGDRYWYQHTVNYFTYQDMATYTNIDPGVDKGQSYMDAGTVYFKETSQVLTNKAVAFHNGLTYCVAPILRQSITSPSQASSGPTLSSLPTKSGFIPPQSGSVDFWAVGTDCCGASGNEFTCGDTRSLLARTGLRLLDDTSRSMYLLAVQEWSATTGLPVRHPLFFQWVKDPISYQDQILNTAWDALAASTAVCFAVCIGVGFFVHFVLQKLRVQ